MDFVHNPYRCGPLRVGRYGLASSLLDSPMLKFRKYPAMQTNCMLYHCRAILSVLYGTFRERFP